MARSGPTTVLLVRHGTTATTGTILPGRAPGLHLSDKGVAEAEAVAERIRALARTPAAIYTSPLERARETAAPIARATRRRAVVERSLLECDFGEWTGRRLSALRRRSDWRHVQESPSAFRFPGGESFVEMQLRAWSCVERLAATHKGRSIVLVSHADPIKAVVTFALGVPLDLFQRTVISPCSVSAIMVTSGSPIVLCVNSTAALGDLVAS